MTVQEKLDKIETMEDLFSLSIDITKGLINVATLAYVKNVSLDKSEKYYNVDVKPFPLKEDQEEYELSCYCNNRIGEKLKAIRLSRNITQQSLAEASAISLSSVKGT